MNPILKTIAKEYSLRYHSLKEFCFIFPNKRCGIFFRKYLSEFEVFSEDLPHILTVSEFMVQVARRPEADKIFQLFTLYNSYLKLLGGNKGDKDVNVEFEEFRGWGETVLNDFNTVDNYMADAEQIFRNVKDYREIASNFLTEDQLEVMQEYFGIENITNTDDFWKIFNEQGEESDLKSRYLNLWQIMYPLYEDFHKSLASRGLATGGWIARQAAEKIVEKGKEVLPYKKVVAVDFNALTEAQRRIFRSLSLEEGYEGCDDFIDFIWDATGPILNSENFSASKFVDSNKKHFPGPKWFEDVMKTQEVTEWPEIEIISSPSNTAQTKIAGEILRRYSRGNLQTLIEDAEVALVLPDEALLSNMLYSIPDGLDNVNLTMGVSLRNSPVAAFVYLLRRLYSSMREGKGKNYIFTKDLRMFLSHPFSSFLFAPDEIHVLLDFITRRHKVSIISEELTQFIPSASDFLDFPSKDKKGPEVFRFVEKILKRLSDIFSSENNAETHSREIGEMEVYMQYMQQLEESMKLFGIDMEPLAVMRTIDRIVGNQKVGFEGQPLVGLQIMGTLETRTLDFRHIILLSMNEGVMPRRATSASFIPESLRSFYGLPPARYAEEIFGYYFYRLISRAEKVTLIYDGRTITGMRNGESRYLLQLKEYAPKDKIKIEAWKFPLQNREETDASIEKTPEIFEMTEVFSATDDSRKNLSASSLNTYRECQVKFFLQNLLNLSTDPAPSDYMDPITVGNVLHEVMMDIYLTDINLQGKLLENPVVITPQRLNDLLKNTSFIKDTVELKIAKYFFGEKEGKKSETESGVIRLMASQIEQLVKEIVAYDRRYAPFRLYGCEIAKNLWVKLENGRVVNFRFAIDRLDEIEENGRKTLRIVDYKTGIQKCEAPDLESVFKGGFKSEQIFQLFVYAWLLQKIGVKNAEDVITEIYSVPAMVKGERIVPKIGSDKDKTKEKGKEKNKKKDKEREKVEHSRYSNYADNFSHGLEALIEDIFSGQHFRQAPEPDQCTHCDFKSFCNK